MKQATIPWCSNDDFYALIAAIMELGLSDKVELCLDHITKELTIRIMGASE